METELKNAVLAMDDPTPVKPLGPKKLVVFIDTQVDFMVDGSALYVKDAEPLIGKLNNFAYHLDPAEVEAVLFTFDTHDKASYEGSEEAKMFPIHCEKGKPGWENVINHKLIHNDIQPFFLHKGVFDMWAEENVLVESYHTGWAEPRSDWIEQYEFDGINHVVIVGVAADFCVKWAADGFLNRGWHVEIPRGLTAGIVRDIDKVVLEDYESCNVLVTG